MPTYFLVHTHIYMPYTIHHSPFTIHNSQLTTHNTQYTIHNAMHNIIYIHICAHSLTSISALVLTCICLRVFIYEGPAKTLCSDRKEPRPTLTPGTGGPQVLKARKPMRSSLGDTSEAEPWPIPNQAPKPITKRNKSSQTAINLKAPKLQSSKAQGPRGVDLR